MARFRRVYGAPPWHLLGHIALFAVAVYALSEVFQTRFARPVNTAAWMLTGPLLHDLVFLPIYVLADIAIRVVLGENELRRVPLANHLRVPVVMSAVLLLVWFPLILDKAPAAYRGNTGHGPPDALGRWALITAGLFVVSGLSYAVRAMRARATPAAPAAHPPPHPAAPRSGP